MPYASNASIEIYYEFAGDPKGPPILLIMGLGAQLVHWPSSLVDSLVELGCFVIRYDHRDVGMSSKLTALGPPNLSEIARAAASGRPASPPYTLSDMALDALAVLDALGIASAHVVGASLGGMVAQMLAIEHPGRVRSLTSIMSTTGARSLPPPSPEVLSMLMRSRSTDDPERAIQDAIDSYRVLAVTPSDFDEARARIAAELAHSRGVGAYGVARQLAAVLAASDREAHLAKLDLPCLVMHGALDPLISVEGGRRTQRCIPGSRIVVFPEMGHYLPARVVESMVREIHQLIERCGRAEDAAVAPVPAQKP